MRKVCFKCGQEKELDEFYPHPQMGDGHLNKCKECNKLDVKRDYYRKSQDPNWIESERKRGREKHRRLYSGIKKKNTTRMSWKHKYPEKVEAASKAQHIKTPDGKEKHHWSYNEEHYKDVIFLTKAEHMKAHRFIIYDQERKMYRTTKGILLDSRESHERYIDDKIINEQD